MSIQSFMSYPFENIEKMMQVTEEFMSQTQEKNSLEIDKILGLIDTYLPALKTCKFASFLGLGTSVVSLIFFRSYCMKIASLATLTFAAITFHESHKTLQGFLFLKHSIEAHPDESLPFIQIKSIWVRFKTKLGETFFLSDLPPVQKAITHITNVISEVAQDAITVMNVNTPPIASSYDIKNHQTPGGDISDLDD